MTSILVVDDDRDVRQLIAYTLEAAGFEVREAADGGAALEALEASEPDAMVLDATMPGVDGFAVLARRGQRKLATRTRVIMLSGRALEKDMVRSFELGADEYMTKPFDPEVLVAGIRDLVQVSHEDLDERRAVELEKALLLERLESAFNRPRARR